MVRTGIFKDLVKFLKRGLGSLRIIKVPRNIMSQNEGSFCLVVIITLMYVFIAFKLCCFKRILILLREQLKISV